MAGKTNGGLKVGNSSPIRQKAEQAGKATPKAEAAGKQTGAIRNVIEKRESGNANPIITQMGRALGEKLGTLPREEKQNRQQLVGGGNQPSGKSGLQLGQWGADQSAPLTNRALTGGGGTFLGGGGSMGAETAQPKNSGMNADTLFGKAAGAGKDLFGKKEQPAALGPMTNRTLTGNNEKKGPSPKSNSSRMTTQPAENRERISPANGGGGTFLGGGGVQRQDTRNGEGLTIGEAIAGGGLSGVWSAGTGAVNAAAGTAAKNVSEASPAEVAKSVLGIRDRQVGSKEHFNDLKNIWKDYDYGKEGIRGLGIRLKDTLFKNYEYAVREIDERGGFIAAANPSSAGAIRAGKAIFSYLFKQLALPAITGSTDAKENEKWLTDTAYGLTDKATEAVSSIPGLEYVDSRKLNEDLGKSSKAAAVAGRVSNVLGNMLPAIGADLAGRPDVGLMLMGISAGGNTAKEVYDATGSAEDAYYVGVMAGLTETGTEKMFDAAKIFGGGAISNGLKGLMKEAALTKTGRALLKGGELLGENVEEAASDWAQPGIQKAVLGETLDNIRREQMGLPKEEDDLSIAEALLGQAPWTEEGFTTLLSTVLLNGMGTVIHNNIITVPAEQAQEILDIAKNTGNVRLQNLAESYQRILDRRGVLGAEKVNDIAQATESITGRSMGELRLDAALEQAISEMAEEQTGSSELASADESTSVDTDPEGHTEEEKQIIKEYQAAVDTDLAEFALDVLMSEGDEANGWFYELKPVSDRAAEDMQRITGVDAHGFKAGIHGSQIQHIDIRHGLQSPEDGDKSMRDINDVARMQYVLDNYDDVKPGKGTTAYRTNTKDGKQKAAKTVEFSKKVDGTYYVIEAVPDTKARTAYVVSVYIGNNNPGGGNAADANAPTRTADTEGSQTPGAENTVSQGTENSNNEFTGGLQLGAQQEGAQNETVQQETAPAQPGLPGQTPTQPGTGEPGLRLGAADTIRTGADAGAQAAVGGDRTDLSGGNGRRDAGGRAGGQAGRVVGNAGAGGGPAAEGNGRQAAGAILGNALREQGIEKQSSRSFGIERGTDTDLFQVVPEDSYEASWSDLKYKLELSTGYKVHFIIGPMEIMGSDGKPHKINGCCDHTSGRIIIRVDSRLYSPDQIGRHEEFHVLAKRDPGLVKEIQNRIVARYGRDEMARIFRGYQEKRRGINDIRSGNQAALSEEFSELCEEIFADAYGRMNAFGFGADSFMGTVAGTIGDRRDRIWNRETRGPPAQERLQNIENEKRDLMDLLSSLQRAGNGYTDPSGNYYTEEDADRIAQHLADLDEQSEKLKQNQGSQKYTYAGESAWNADYAALNVAQEMEQEGADAETIREDTGWFRGMDGRWRFEIDDSDSTYSRYGDASMRRRNADYVEYQNLMEKLLYGQLTPEEEKRIAALDDLWGRELGRLSALVDSGNAYLNQLLDHEKLYSEYPKLRKTRVIFEELSRGNKGSYNPASNTITLNSNLRDDAAEARSTLLHEVQHAIQAIEGFTSGASVEYWANRNYQEHEETAGELAKLRDSARELRDELEIARKKAGYDEFVDRAYEAAEAGEITWDEADERINEFERSNRSLESLNNAIDEIYRKIDRIDKSYRDPAELYRNTAGEIEARDVQSRRDLNREERRNKAPNLGDEDTVFAETPGQRHSAEEEDSVANQSGTDYNAITDPKLERAISLVKAGARPSTVFAETGLVKLGNGDILNPETGDIVWRNDNGNIRADKEGGAAVETTRNPEGAVPEHDRRGAVRRVGEDDRGKREWSALTERNREKITDAVDEHIRENNDSELQNLLSLTNIEGLAEDVYQIFSKGRAAFEVDDLAKLLRYPDSLYDRIKEAISEEGGQDYSVSEDEDQITMDDLTEGDYSLSATVGPQHERELARILKSHVKDLLVGYQAEGRYDPITEEDIDDWMDADEYHDNMASLFNDGEQVLDELYLLSEDEPWEREEIYYLMERIVRTLNPETAQKYTMENVRRETRPAEEYYSGLKLQSVIDAAGEYGSDYPNFARWYNSRNPSIYYPDYEPGDLFDAGKNIQSSRALNRVNENYDREMEYLRSLIDDPSVSEETRKDAEDFYNRMANPHEQWTVPDANGEDRTYREVFYSADEDSDRRESTGEEELGEARLTEAEKEIAELKKDNEQLKEYAEYWKRQGRITGRGENRARRSDVQRFAKELIEHADYQGDKAELRQKLQDLANMIASNDGGSGLNWESVHEAAEEIAELLVDNSYQMVDPEKDTRENLKNRLKELKIRPDEMWTHDFGDWADFRRKQFGKLVFSREGQSIDDVYKILRSEFGDGLFPETETAGSDQIRQILHALDQLAPERAYNFANDEEADLAASYYTNRVTDELLFGNIREELTQADKNYQKVKDRMQRAEEKVRQLRTEKRELQRMQHNEVRAALQEQRKNLHQREETQKVRKSITKTAKRLLKYLDENTGKNPIPEPMKEAVGNLLLNLDISGGMEKHQKERYLESMQNVAKIVAQQFDYMNGQDNAWDGMYLDLPPDIRQELDEHLENVRKAIQGEENRGRTWNPNMMNLEELQRLDEILTAVSSAIQSANEILSDERGRKISEMAEPTIRYVNQLGKDKNRSEPGEKLNNFLRLSNTTPYYFFKKLGPVGTEMFERLQEGWDKFAFNAKKIIDFANKTYTAKEVKEIQQKTETFQLRKRGDMTEGFDKPETVSMTHAQIMSLYCLWKREQARNHIAGAGIRIADFKNEKGKNVKQAENYLIDLDDIAKMVATLTPREREIADALQKYMNTVGSDWGNEVSLRRFGIRSFTEDNYFPIETDDRTRPVRSPERDSTDLYRLLNMGFTKATKRNASNALVVNNIFDVFSNHMADMAKYNGLGLPMLDTLKWFSFSKLGEQDENGQYGYESIQKSIDRAFGRGARNYFTTFIKDLNGVQEAGRGEGPWNAFLSNYKVAAVGANLRVAMLQPTSYTRAAAVLDWKYLAKGLTMDNKKGREEALKHSGTAVWKDMGFYDTNINAGLREIIKHDDGLKEKVQDAAMKGAEMGDKITWGALWNACKAEQMDKGLKGEELIAETAKRFREVIYRTQVLDSTMTRSHLMRQKGGIESMVTAFMSEPTLAYNMMLDAYSEYEADRRKGLSRKNAWEKNGKYIASTGAAYVTTATLAAFVESLIDAARDDDEYATFLERFLQKFPKNWLEDVMIHNKLPIIKDFAGMLKGQGTSRMDTEWMANIIKAGQIWWETLALQIGWQKDPSKITYNGNMTMWGKIYNTLRAVSQLAGLPFGNAVRDAVAIYNSTIGELPDAKKIQTYNPGEAKKIQYAVQDGYLSEEEAIDWLLHYELADSEDEARQQVYVWAHPERYERILSAMNAGDREEFDAAMQELKDLHFKPSNIEAAISKEIHERYVGRDGEEPIDRETAKQMLMDYGGMIQRKADEQVQKWTSEIETGVSFSDIGASYVAGDISRDQAVQMLMDYGGYAQDKAEAKVQQWTCEIDTGIGYSEIGDRFFYDEITRDEAVDMYMKYGGKTQEEAEDAVNKIAFRKETGHERERAELQTMYMEGEYSRDQMKDMMLEYGYSKTEESAENSLIRWDFIGTDYEELDAVSPWQAKRYFEMVEDAEIDRKTYLQFAEAAEQMSVDYDENGKQIAYSKMKKVLAYIDGLDLSDEQKTALAMAGWDSSNKGYSEANINKYAPWEGGSSTTTKKKSGGGRRGGGGGGRRGSAPAGNLVLGEATDTGHRGIYDQILIGWRKRKYSRAQILAMVRAGILTQEEADEILATTQDEGEADGSLTLGATEELSA